MAPSTLESIRQSQPRSYVRRSTGVSAAKRLSPHRDIIAEALSIWLKKNGYLN
jgi:hypothetical protein